MLLYKQVYEQNSDLIIINSIITVACFALQTMKKATEMKNNVGVSYIYSMAVHCFCLLFVQLPGLPLPSMCFLLLLHPWNFC